MLGKKGELANDSVQPLSHWLVRGALEFLSVFYLIFSSNSIIKNKKIKNSSQITMQLGKEKIKHLYGALVTYLIAAKNT